ncbi:hypothetical protein BC827DRAFT_172996 [Russula dissimulans]|nr:hypothetical protein BC827DRAFT_172996 [Russula dissimulans]
MNPTLPSQSRIGPQYVPHPNLMVNVSSPSSLSSCSSPSPSPSSSSSSPSLLPFLSPSAFSSSSANLRPSGARESASNSLSGSTETSKWKGIRALGIHLDITQFARLHVVQDRYLAIVHHHRVRWTVDGARSRPHIWKGVDCMGIDGTSKAMYYPRKRQSLVSTTAVTGQVNKETRHPSRWI